MIRDRALAERLAGEPMPDGAALAVRPEALAPVAAEAPGAVPARLLGRQFLGLTAEWTLSAAGPDGIRLRLWTEPDRPVPDVADPAHGALAVAASRWRWVPDDANPAAEAG